MILRDPRFANGVSLVLLCLLCVRMDVLTVADVGTIVLGALALLSNRLTSNGGIGEDGRPLPHPACDASHCPGRPARPPRSIGAPPPPVDGPSSTGS